VRLIVGLGNPGSDYEDTPHNIGFAVTDELARRVGAAFKKGPVPETVVAQLPAAHDAVLVKPLAYMNLSGRPVGAALRWYKIEPTDLIVVCDDVNLPYGRMRIRASGGGGGQKGLVSILQAMGTDNFPRLRMGVGGGYPGADVGSYVLRKQRGKELDNFRELAARGADAIEHWLSNGLEAAMNRFNILSESE